MKTDRKTVIGNSKLADSSSKLIFEDNILCCQFLRDYIELPYFSQLQPEDIEDVSEQFVPLFAEERNADRVKKVSIRNMPPFFLISLIEHKSLADFDVSMQILRYMIHIWEKYAKEAEKVCKGITKKADFKYPPILPIVYYEGSNKWSVPFDLKSRIMEGDAFEKYIPNFEYYLVPLQKYSNEELLNKKDEISLVMMINKMQNPTDVEMFRKLPAEQVEKILQDTPEYIVDIISNILRAFLLKMNLPVDETEELVGKVKEKKMGYLFENMEKMDIQEERRKTAEERRKQEEARREAEKAKKETEEAKKETEEAKKETEEAKKETEKSKEDAIRIFIEGYQELNASKEITLKKIREKFGLEEECANQKMKHYWKEEV